MLTFKDTSLGISFHFFLAEYRGEHLPIIFILRHSWNILISPSHTGYSHSRLMLQYITFILLQETFPQDIQVKPRSVFALGHVQGSRGGRHPCLWPQQGHQPGWCSLLSDCWCPAAQGVPSRFHLQNPQFALWALKMKWNHTSKAKVDINGMGFECSSLFKHACGYECALPYQWWPSSPGCSY